MKKKQIVWVWTEVKKEGRVTAAFMHYSFREMGIEGKGMLE